MVMTVVGGASAAVDASEALRAVLDFVVDDDDAGAENCRACWLLAAVDADEVDFVDVDDAVEYALALETKRGTYAVHRCAFGSISICRRRRETRVSGAHTLVLDNQQRSTRRNRFVTWRRTKGSA